MSFPYVSCAGNKYHMSPLTHIDLITCMNASWISLQHMQNVDVVKIVDFIKEKLSRLRKIATLRKLRLQFGNRTQSYIP